MPEVWRQAEITPPPKSGHSCILYFCASIHFYPRPHFCSIATMTVNFNFVVC